MASHGSAITLQVCDLRGQTYHVQLQVDEPTATGTLTVRHEATGSTQQHALSALQKSQHGKALQCKVGMATATFTLQEAQDPPRLHLQARVFVPVFDETYTLAPAEHQRLSAWMDALRPGASA